VSAPHVVLVERAVTREAARAMLPLDVRLRLRYRGVWLPPRLERTLVHVFGESTFEELQQAGWTFVRHG
jgi:hypothetical protein